MDKYFIGASDVPVTDGYPRADVLDLAKKKGILAYMVGMDYYDRLKELDEIGAIHLGMRNFRGDQFEALPYARFNGNYLIFSKEWREDKYEQFKKFVPKPEIAYPEAVYVKISEFSDEEALEKAKILENLDKNGLLGIDFETAGSPEDLKSEYDGFPEYEHFLPLGMAISDKKQGIYFDFDDFQAQKPQKLLFFEYLEQFIDKNKARLMAFNVSFEMGCLFDIFGKYFELGDARAWCIVDNHKENLKYLSQYYCGVQSWDYENDLQLKGLEELFRNGDYLRAAADFRFYQGMPDRSFKEFKAAAVEWTREGIRTYDDKKIYFVWKTFELNRDNPDFLPRLKKYWNNTWASTNQRILGKYCVIDAVMDIYITEAVRAIELDGKKYTEDAYQVYLYNQYLGAHIESSGIAIDIPYLKTLIEFYETLYFNSLICVSQFITYTRRGLLEKDPDLIRIDLPEKLRCVVSDCLSQFFLEPDPIKMGKEFVKFLRAHPEAFHTVVTKYQPELFYLYDMAKAVHEEDKSRTASEEYYKYNPELVPEDTKLTKFLRKRSVFAEIAGMVAEELDLPGFFAYFNEKYLEKTNINSKILVKYWQKDEKELVRRLKDDDFTGIDPHLVPELRKYVWDRTRLTDPEALKKSFSQYIYDSRIAEYEKIADRKVTDPIDHSLDRLIVYDFNSPLVRKAVALDLQAAYEIPVTVAGLYFSFKNGRDALDTFTRAEYEVFRDKVDSQVRTRFQGKYENLPQMHKRLFRIVEEKGDYGKVIRTYEERKVWSAAAGRSAGGDEGYGGSSTWDGLKASLYRDRPFRPDLTFRHIKDDPVDCFCKFFGYMEMNLGAEKTLTTTLRPMLQNSYNYSRQSGGKDPMHVLWTRNGHDPDKPQLYKIEVHVNSVHTGRWASNFHTLPPEDDGRLALKFQDGYIGSYFDISQAEPRSICYLSRDPDFMELYDSGKDAYLELAKLAFPQHMEDKALIKLHRKQCKGIILSGLYGRGIKGLAKSLGFSVEDANQVWTSFIGKMRTVARFKDELLDYAEKHGRVRTILGNRIPVDPERVHTSSMNYVIQGFTAVILAAGFYNSVAEAVSRGINVSVKGVVHDSSTCEFPIRQLLHMDLHYRKFFREWIRCWWNPDYKYDLDILQDYRHHCPYHFDLETGTVTISMWTGYAESFLDHFADGYSFRVGSRTDTVLKDYKGGLLNDLASVKRTHNYMDTDYARRISVTDLTLVLQEPLRDIDWFHRPISEFPKWGSRTLSFCE